MLSSYLLYKRRNRYLTVTPMFSTITVNTVIIRALSAKASKRTEKPRRESSGGIFSVLPSCPTNKCRSNRTRNRSSTDNNETERQSVEPRGKDSPADTGAHNSSGSVHAPSPQSNRRRRPIDKHKRSRQDERPGLHSRADGRSR